MKGDRGVALGQLPVLAIVGRTNDATLIANNDDVIVLRPLDAVVRDTVRQRVFPRPCLRLQRNAVNEYGQKKHDASLPSSDENRCNPVSHEHILDYKLGVRNQTRGKYILIVENESGEIALRRFL